LKIVCRPVLQGNFNRMKSVVAASLVGKAAADYQCPGGPWVTHAGLRMTSTASASCDVVKSEMQARVAGTNGWYDQHNRGTYTLQNYGGDISMSRLTGDGKYTDKMTFVLTSEGSGCKIEGCSEAQVFSIADFGTNYCEQKLMYCGSDEGCNVAQSDFRHNEVETKTMAGATTGMSNCLKVEEEKLSEPRQYAKGFVRMPRNDVVKVATITDEMRSAAPDRVDWTETAGAVSPVKDQAQCGSCWAFSATEGIEAGVFQTEGVVSPPLSPQQIVSCDKSDGGCNGGDLPTAFDYVEGAGGIDTEEDYPYSSQRGRTGRCLGSTPVVTVTDYAYGVAPCEGGACSGQDEDGLKAALATYGPLSVCVNAETWNSYYGGVFTDACSGSYNSLDHCVQLVGYDAAASTPYWKVRNSWGTSWGEGGFIRLPMGVNSCGIADEAMYVSASLTKTAVV
jgi:C1A family cysteine protease